MTYVRPVVVIVVFVLSVFASGSRAQISRPHQHAAPSIIDGAVHPELIPDSTAWRLWLATVSLSPNATEKERMFQQAHLATLRLGSVDSVQLNAILTEFKGQYSALIARYNESAKALGSQADKTLFRQQRDDLVSTTRAAIAQRLAPEIAARIDAHVQEQKTHIRLTGVQGQ